MVEKEAIQNDPDSNTAVPEYQPEEAGRRITRASAADAAGH